MRQRRSRFAAAALAALAVLVAAAAALAAPDPLRLALQKSDFPAGVHGSTARSPASGVRAFGIAGLKAANLTFSWPAGGTVNTSLGPADKEWLLVGDVFVAPNEAGARKLFELGKRAGGFFSDVAGLPQYVTSGLPRYGDEQLAYTWTQRATGLHAVLVVRKKAVVWQLMVGPVPRQWRVTKTQVLHELQTYALKEKARVGSG